MGARSPTFEGTRHRSRVTFFSSCLSCRYRRLRCDGDEPCGPCGMRGLECRYLRHHRRRSSSWKMNPKARQLALKYPVWVESAPSRLVELVVDIEDMILQLEREVEEEAELREAVAAVDKHLRAAFTKTAKDESKGKQRLEETRAGEHGTKGSDTVKDHDGDRTPRGRQN